MEVLNRSYGPNVFYATCAAAVFFNILIFVWSGYISPLTLLKIFGIRQAPSMSQQLYVAEQEEVRRARQSEYTRSMGALYRPSILPRGTLDTQDSHQSLNGSGLLVRQSDLY